MAEGGERTADLGAVLAALADAKHDLGRRYASWVGRAPSIEANIAVAGMAQEEEGHAMALEGVLPGDAGRPAVRKEQLVHWHTWPQAAAEPPGAAGEPWPEALARMVANEASTGAALAVLAEIDLPRIADRVRKMIQEEQFHRAFGHESLRAIAAAGPGAGRRLAAAYMAAAAAERSRGQLAAAIAAAGRAGALGTDAADRYAAQLAEADRQAAAAAMDTAR